MRKTPLIAAAALLAALLWLPAQADAAKFKALKTDRCYEILKEGFINKYWNIYKCGDCRCDKKGAKEPAVFETIGEAITYLERKYGDLEPR